MKWNTFPCNSAYFCGKKLEVIKVFKSVLEPVNYSWIDFIKAHNTYEGKLAKVLRKDLTALSIFINNINYLTLNYVCK